MFNTAVVIDDDVDLCHLVKAILHTTVVKVECAHTISEGKTMLGQVNPDLIFLDNNLPDGQGLDMIKEIKASRPSSIVVMISALDNIKQKALGQGADWFIEKPLSYPGITEMMRVLQAA